MLNVVPATLSNGLRVLVLHLPHLHSVSHAFFVRTGPRYETDATNGVSHLVEHLVFRGTEVHPDSYALNVAVEALGGEINGLTQRDATTIHMTVPPRAAAEGLALLGEICARPLLQGLDVERDVVMEELLDTMDATGCELDVDVLSRRALWAGHPMGLPIAGTPATVEALTEADCRAHYAKTFVVENAVLCIAGPVDAKEMIETAERAFAPLGRGARLPERPAPVPPHRPAIQVQAMEDSQVSVLLTYPAPHENHTEFAALLLLKRVLDDGLGARLRQAVCEQRGLAYSLSASIDAYGDVGALDVELSCAPKKLVAAVAETLKTLRTLAEQPIGEDELARAKTRHRADLEFALDDPSEMCGWFGAMELVGCRATYEERLTEVLAVTTADLQRLARRILDPQAALLTLLGPAEESDTRRLELLLGREKDSTVWLNTDEAEDDDEALAS
ncbi:insulinase family protein [Myxococcota bacterium]|nr:insulinase family protein [Myxococcota bacterium]